MPEFDQDDADENINPAISISPTTKKVLVDPYGDRLGRTWGFGCAGGVFGSCSLDLFSFLGGLLVIGYPLFGVT